MGRYLVVFFFPLALYSLGKKDILPVWKKIKKDLHKGITTSLTSVCSKSFQNTIYADCKSATKELLRYHQLLNSARIENALHGAVLVLETIENKKIVRKIFLVFHRTKRRFFLEAYTTDRIFIDNYKLGRVLPRPDIRILNRKQKRKKRKLKKLAKKFLRAVKEKRMSALKSLFSDTYWNDKSREGLKKARRFILSPVLLKNPSVDFLNNQGYIKVDVREEWFYPAR